MRKGQKDTTTFSLLKSRSSSSGCHSSTAFLLCHRRTKPGLSLGFNERCPIHRDSASSHKSPWLGKPAAETLRHDATSQMRDKAGIPHPQPCRIFHSLNRFLFIVLSLLLSPSISKLDNTIEMADPFSTVAAAVSFVDVTIRACRGINVVIGNWNDAPNAIQLLRQTVQNVQSTLEGLRLYVLEYESSKFFTDHHQLLPEVVKNEIRDISLDLSLLQRRLPPADARTRRTHRFKWIFDEKKVLDVVRRLDSRQIAVMTALQSLAQ